MKKLNKDYTEQVLRIYRDIYEEADRPQLAGHHLVDFEGTKYFSSTDAHRLILIPKQDFELKLNDHPKSVNIAGILIPSEKFNLSIPIDSVKIMDLCKDIPMVNELIECESCDGEGTFEHYGHYYNCDHCNGSGEVTSSNKVRDPKYLIQFENTTISNDFAYDLIKVCSAIKDSIFTLVYSTKQQAVFKIGDMLTIIMAKGPLEDNTILKY